MPAYLLFALLLTSVPLYAKRERTVTLIGHTDKGDIFKPELFTRKVDVDELTVSKIRELAQLAFNVQPDRIGFFQEMYDHNGNAFHYVLTDQMVKNFENGAKVVALSDYSIRLFIKNTVNNLFLDGIFNLSANNLMFIKNQIWQWWHVPIENQTLTFKGKILNDKNEKAIFEELRKEVNRRDMTVVVTMSKPKSINVEDAVGGKFKQSPVYPYSSVQDLKKAYCDFANKKPENKGRPPLMPESIYMTFGANHEELKDVDGVLPIKLSTCNECTVKVGLRQPKSGRWTSEDFTYNGAIQS
ncbi:hypothetical protein DdX_17265 [Ditylenchus destructor]|uniref:Uncharacterized protein n=1 Tax=Ditylenchus destructor TaxID=166010 RepID=A0AAD4MMG4_9BILA|nr:hypothetical protein DdX_17265 [Ditylenchus destructor]